MHEINHLILEQKLGWNKSHGRYDTNSQIKSNNAIPKSSLCDAFIVVDGTITVTGREVNQSARQANERDNHVIFQHFAPFTDFLSEISNAQADDAKDLDAVMHMYN